MRSAVLLLQTEFILILDTQKAHYSASTDYAPRGEHPVHSADFLHVVVSHFLFQQTHKSTLIMFTKMLS